LHNILQYAINKRADEGWESRTGSIHNPNPKEVSAMSDYQDTTAQEIPKGFCQCGCGRKTNLAKKTYASEGIRKGEPRSYLPGHNPRETYGAIGKLNGRWNDGKTKNKGYILVMNPDHPRANPNGYVLEHLLAMEKHLGRPILPTEAVHHIDGNKANNAIENLQLFETWGKHLSFHARLRAFQATGHWDWVKCKFCKQYDAPTNMFVSKVNNNNYHRACCRKYEREKYHLSRNP